MDSTQIPKVINRHRLTAKYEECFNGHKTEVERSNDKAIKLRILAVHEMKKVICINLAKSAFKHSMYSWISDTVYIGQVTSPTIRSAVAKLMIKYVKGVRNFFKGSL